MDEQNKATPAAEAGGAKKSNHHKRHHARSFAGKIARS